MLELFTFFLYLNVMIDTLSISKQLQESGLVAKEADAIAMQMGRLIDSDLASKQNLKETELTLTKDIEGLRLEMRKEIEGVRLDIKNVELRILDRMNAHLKWVVGFLVGQAAVIVTLLKLLGD